MKHNVKSQLISTFIAFSLLMSIVGNCATVFANEKRWQEELTADGWMKVTQTDGPTLGYSPDSGVTLIEDDGFAFKDLNRNGALDPYEDWRLDAGVRAANLVSLMSVEEQLPLMLLKEYDMQYKKGSIDSVLIELDSGMRAICTPFVLGDIESCLAYINGIQNYVEGLGYGIPVEVCAEAGVSLASEWLSNLSFGATFDPELVWEYAKMMAEEYRALGISGMMTPQTDLSTEPRWSRITGTFGEDPQLSADMVTAFVDGLQSTYDENGNDLGWGKDSIITQVKHYPGDGAAEGGREAHSADGKYNVYPGDNFYTHLIPFTATLTLPGKTESAVGIMPSYSIAIDADGEPFDDEAVASGFSNFKLTEILRTELGYDGVITSDFVITIDGGGNMPGRVWGVEDLTVAERKLLSIEAGMDRFGGESDVEGMNEAYQLGVEKHGEEFMQERIAESVERILKNQFRVGLFENAYSEKAYVETVVNTEDKQAAGYEAMQKSVVMLKNSGNLIQAAKNDEKPTVYIPMVYTAASFSMFGGASPAKWSLPIDLATAREYFTIVTDKVSDTLTGPADESGKATVAFEDIIRATDEELADCEYALVCVSSPSSSGYDSEKEEYIPISLQYGEYTADSEYVRLNSLGGDQIEVTIDSPYGSQTITETENRTYYGKKAKVSNASDLDTILYAAERVEKVMVVIKASKPMVFNEFEDKVDAIVMYFDGGMSMGPESFSKQKALFDVISGKVEPSGLLPIQMPLNMEVVEAQYEDVPRDMECHVDADGNAYDFTFGLNWSGVINDERVAKYNVEPLCD